MNYEVHVRAPSPLTDIITNSKSLSSIILFLFAATFSPQLPRSILLPRKQCACVILSCAWSQRQSPARGCALKERSQQCEGSSSITSAQDLITLDCLECLLCPRSPGQRHNERDLRHIHLNTLSHQLPRGSVLR
jgi:hypothetical protein